MQAGSPLKPSLIYEFLGSALMVYAYNIGAATNSGIAYFIGWMLAYHISGAEFNPAVSFASFFARKDWSKGSLLGLTLVAQLLGSFFGVFLVFLLLSDKGTFTLKPPGTPMFNNLFDPLNPEPYWARILFLSVVPTFLFITLYLVIRFERSMKKVDRMIKGLGVSFAMTGCLSMTAGAGACLNPALGLVQSLYMIGLENRQGSSLGTDDAKYLWVYVVGPFLGCGFATLFYLMHNFIDRHEYK